MYLFFKWIIRSFYIVPLLIYRNQTHITTSHSIMLRVLLLSLHIHNIICFFNQIQSFWFLLDKAKRVLTSLFLFERGFLHTFHFCIYVGECVFCNNNYIPIRLVYIKICIFNSFCIDSRFIYLLTVSISKPLWKHSATICSFAVYNHIMSI